MSRKNVYIQDEVVSDSVQCCFAYFLVPSIRYHNPDSELASYSAEH